MAGSAVADLTSASFTVRGSHVSAGASVALSGPSFGGVAATGQPQAVGFSGAASDLGTTASGFVPVLVGALPTLDGDADGIAFFLDPDDDGDGLLDDVETNTGVFASPGNTGTDSLAFDTDGDGFSDGAEVAAGSDPTNPLSTPGAQLPALSPIASVCLALAIVCGALLEQTRSRRKRS